MSADLITRQATSSTSFPVRRLDGQVRATHRARKRCPQDTARKTDDHLTAGCRPKCARPMNNTTDGGVHGRQRRHHHEGPCGAHGPRALRADASHRRSRPAPPRCHRPTSTSLPPGPTDWPAWFSKCGSTLQPLPPDALNFPPHAFPARCDHGPQDHLRP